jgi:uncharacterized Ntn-hydrolase superfamily protein
MHLNTYSVVARCERTGELGAAVASAVPAVAAICLHLRPGVGAVSSQSWVNPYLGGAILDRLAAGASTAEAVAAALAEDPGAAVRQVGAIGVAGPGAFHTGADCTPWFGAEAGATFAVQGNMLTGPEVVAAMARAIAAAPDLPLEERLMRTLEAAQDVGGDKRGKQSAGLAVIGTEEYRRVDLRVDEHEAPVAQLRRILEVARHQLAPFVAGMTRRGAPPAPAPDAVVAMLRLSPPDRPGGGGSREP